MDIGHCMQFGFGTAMTELDSNTKRAARISNLWLACNPRPFLSWVTLGSNQRPFATCPLKFWTMGVVGIEPTTSIV